MKTGYKETLPINLYEWPEEKAWSLLPFWLPKGKSGPIEIHHDIAPKGSKLPVVSFRNSIFMGLPVSSMLFEQDTIIHRMSEEDVSERWISTLPQEVEQHQRQLKNAHGRVLVGGLGIGIAVAMLQQNPKVKTIHVVELSRDLIGLVQPYLPKGKNLAVFPNDINEFLRGCRETNDKYDFAFLDTWCPTGQMAWLEYVLPLRQACKGIVPQDMIECWNEDEMIGQIALSLHNWTSPDREAIRAMMFKDGDPFDMPPEEFRGWGSCSTGGYPFLAWMHENQSSPAEAEAELGRYLYALKDAVEYDEVWKPYEDYGIQQHQFDPKLTHLGKPTATCRKCDMMEKHHINILGGEVKP